MAAAARPHPLPLVLDADPGHDDALAIVLAGHTPGVDLLLTTTVASNHTLANVTANAAAVLAAAGLGRVPLAAGAARPLLAEARVCPAIHGASGLCTSRGPFVDVLPRLTRGGHAPHRLDQPAAVAIAAAVRAAAAALPPGDRVAVVATGALTNIALLLSLYPDLEGVIAVTFMGGSTVGGNTHPVSEFNIQVDPHAAAAVLAAGERGVPVTMVPLDVTHRALVTPAVLAALGLADPAARAASPLRAALADVLLYFAATYAAEFGFAHPPLHDPLAVFAAFAPASVTKTRVRIDVETASPLCAGQTVVDGRGQTGRPPNAWLVTDADFDAFWGALGGAVGRAADVSPL